MLTSALEQLQIRLELMSTPTPTKSVDEQPQLKRRYAKMADSVSRVNAQPAELLESTVLSVQQNAGYHQPYAAHREEALEGLD